MNDTLFQGIAMTLVAGFCLVIAITDADPAVRFVSHFAAIWFSFIAQMILREYFKERKQINKLT